MAYIKYGFKEIMTVHDGPALQLSKYPEGAIIPEGMTKGKTILIQKGPQKSDNSEQL